MCTEHGTSWGSHCRLNGISHQHPSKRRVVLISNRDTLAKIIYIWSNFGTTITCAMLITVAFEIISNSMLVSLRVKTRSFLSWYLLGIRLKFSELSPHSRGCN